jgi:dephospho-CoA kinase
MARPVAVAVTGGIGAGKSEALKAFARHGAAVLSSDEVVHRLLREDPQVREAVVAELGRGVLDEEGRIDRAAVGRLVFGDPQRVAWLEALLHPRVADAQREWFERLAAREDAPRACAVEIPLLYEVGAEDRFDAVVVITAPEEVRARRTPLATDERAARLLPDEEKVARADFAYVNDGSLDELDAFVADVLGQVT